MRYSSDSLTDIFFSAKKDLCEFVYGYSCISMLHAKSLTRKEKSIQLPDKLYLSSDQLFSNLKPATALADRYFVFNATLLY